MHLTAGFKNVIWKIFQVAHMEELVSIPSWTHGKVTEPLFALFLLLSGATSMAPSYQHEIYCPFPTFYS